MRFRESLIDHDSMFQVAVFFDDGRHGAVRIPRPWEQVGRAPGLRRYVEPSAEIVKKMKDRAVLAAIMAPHHGGSGLIVTTNESEL